ncbi:MULTISPECIES: ATP-binding protein [Ralstonia]|jgi:two-component system sensor histidine kinase QseC|uniref:histidine kinase n=1 Tax=Ralstonia pickettii OR214 TaxID=1264675 RepID=R0CPW2_RALPI|nr:MULTISPECIES: ATP-binding protein [Ralstonia]MEA3271350.1 ATP-binding protein [Pseudomonadota bacterium]ENZ78495.1 signal transduction histidine kinase [Ralstonia pickettii OR214]MBL4777993.1 two-component sensor histidine kinase [Ralstonia sp.]MCM3581031.1 ATP-binding protein [Ralstonia pickettii]OYU22545.1 MAG: two-component sensor histidine kinase [Ralstonia sp. PBBBR1]
MTRPRSLQGRLLLLVLGAVAGLWLITALITWYDAQDEIDQLLDSHLAQAGALLVMQHAQAVDEDDEPSHDLPVQHRYAPKVAFQVFHEGKLGIHSANAPNQPMVAPGERTVSGFSTVQIGGNAWRVFVAQGVYKDIQVYVGERIDSRTAILSALLRNMLWPMALALPLLALAVWWAVKRGMLPLRRLGNALAERDPRALDPVRMPHAPVEMTPMLDALNALFARIQTMLDAERRFTADAAHELRTPIAAIKAQAQVAMAAEEDAMRRHALVGTLEGCDRAAHLVDQLLLLSRLEANAGISIEPIDLGALARQVMADIAPIAFGKKQRIALENPERCMVAGNRALLASLVRNLIDNAIRYSPAEAQIVVTVAHRNGSAALCVEDSGPGLPAAEQHRLGERFFRVEGTDQSGSGLGWSIVRRIAAVHGASVTVDRSPGLGGLRVDVIWSNLTSSGSGTYQ